ncbi:MAG TPA: hypothetical protein VMU16_02530 [Candidatus Binataceae bacterium]|nr:hypothetical protein [Candidatus Binataceae bacterium]
MIPRAVACGAAVAMLVALTAIQSHQYTPHFRVPDMGRLTEQHANPAQPELNAAERIAPAVAFQRMVPPPTIDNRCGTQALELARSAEVLPIRPLRRLKLGPSRPDNPDPLI